LDPEEKSKSPEAGSLFGALIARSGLYFSGLMLGKALTVVATVVLARHFEPAVFGEVVLFMTLTALVTGVADAGLVQWYQMEAPRVGRWAALRGALWSRGATLAISILLLTPLFSGADFLSGDLSLLLLLALVPEAVLSLLEGYYLERGRPLIASARSAGKMAVVLVGLLILGEDFSITDFARCFFAGSILSACILFPWAEISEVRRQALPKVTDIFRAAAPYGVLSVSALAYTRGDSLVVRFALGSGALGFYGVAYRVLESLGTLPAVIALNFFAILAGSKTVQRDHVWTIMAFMGGTGAILAVALFLASRPLIELVFGAEYGPSIVPLQIFSGVLFMNFINAPLSALVQASHSVRQFAPFAVLNTLGNIGLNLIFVPLYGIEAAAWIMLGSEVSGFGLGAYFARRSLFARS
jgi:O-antigen/teichoic acid export membrane protein